MPVTTTVRLPNAIYDRIRRRSFDKRISINQIIYTILERETDGWPGADE